MRSWAEAAVASGKKSLKRASGPSVHMEGRRKRSLAKRSFPAMPWPSLGSLSADVSAKNGPTLEASGTGKTETLEYSESMRSACSWMPRTSACARSSLTSRTRRDPMDLIEESSLAGS